MAKKLQLEITENLDTKTNLITNFELNAEIVAGSLTSNAKELAAKIESKLKNYSVEKYINNPDAAKTDKALLNKVKDAVSDKRKEITKTWNQPLDEFLNEMKTLEKSISDASEKINGIVKEAENTEKNNKRQQIEQYWSTLNFTIVSLDRVFNQKWLNKTYKLEQIMKDCEELIEKITSELNTIKSMDDEDSEILQSFYLETLDLNSTLMKGNQLKNNRAALKKVEESKTVSPERTTIEKESEEWRKEKLKSVTIEIEDPIMEYNLILKGPKSKLIQIRKYMESLGITYTKVGK